jgi:opacity protein-like surface antigen
MNLYRLAMHALKTFGQISTTAPRVAVAAVALFPALAAADTPQFVSDPSWQFDASVYAFLPTIGGTTIFPVQTGGSSVNISARQILDSLNFTFMGSFDAHKGPWGAFTDLIYVDLGASKSNTRDFSIGNIGVPAGTTANLHLDVSGWVWTTAAEYRVADTPGLKMDYLIGARYLDLSEDLSWSISGNLGPIVPAGRSGSSGLGNVFWDGIAGIKGRAAFGADGQWLLPFYLDGGAGDSNTTWQVSAGVGYAFHWGTIDAMWRYLDYEFSGTKIKSIDFNGPMIGATFRW